MRSGRCGFPEVASQVERMPVVRSEILQVLNGFMNASPVSELRAVPPSASSKINLARVEAGARGCHVSQATATCAYHFVLPQSSASFACDRCGHPLILYVPLILSNICLCAVRSILQSQARDLSCASGCRPSSSPLSGMSEIRKRPWGVQFF